MRRSLVLLVFVLLAASAGPVRADVAPSPGPLRPVRPGWDDAPAPLPEPPEEAWRRALPAALLASVTLALAARLARRDEKRARTRAS